MIKGFTLFVAAMVVSISASAQFQEGKGYLDASLTRLDLHYNDQDGFNLGVQAKAGYLPWDNLTVLATFDTARNGSEAVADHISVGAGGRYYVTQNGLYLGAGVRLLCANHNYSNLMPGVEVGYVFFINHSVTIEPAIYYDQSLKTHNYLNIGLEAGLGIYLFDD